MPIATPQDGIPADFTDILLIINVCAIAMLIGVLYVDEIIHGGRRALRALNLPGLRTRLCFWRAAGRNPH